jgi:hypothetical protein
MGEGCIKDEQNNLLNDPRFSKNHFFSINEYDLFLKNGIIDKLKQLNHYSVNQTDYENSMKATYYQTYVRDTIPWKI